MNHSYLQDFIQGVATVLKGPQQPTNPNQLLPSSVLATGKNLKLIDGLSIKYLLATLITLMNVAKLNPAVGVLIRCMHTHIE